MHHAAPRLTPKCTVPLSFMCLPARFILKRIAFGLRSRPGAPNPAPCRQILLFTARTEVSWPLIALHCPHKIKRFGNANTSYAFMPHILISSCPVSPGLISGNDRENVMTLTKICRLFSTVFPSLFLGPKATPLRAGLEFMELPNLGSCGIGVSHRFVRTELSRPDARNAEADSSCFTLVA